MLNITKPTLLLDPDRAKANILKMKLKADQNGLIFRPHFKTHQSAQLANWFRGVGVTKCTVSSLTMAEYFAQAGWDDITVAFPVNTLEHATIARLAEKINLNLLVESPEVVVKLASLVGERVGLFIKIDSGYHRTGIPSTAFAEIQSLIDEIGKYGHFSLRGFLIHDGHTYKARGANEIMSIHANTMAQVAALKKRFSGYFPGAIVSLGDTPTFSVIDSFAGFEEMRPGNFVFYDLAQWQIGSCSLQEIAVCMACPIVAMHRERSEIVLYGGGVHFSKDRISIAGKEVFGLAVHLTSTGWQLPDTTNYVSSLSQEHGVVKVSPDTFDQYHVGDLVGVLPVHACLSAHLMKNYITVHGEMIDRL